MKISRPVRLVLSIALCELVGAIGALFVGSSLNSWFACLRRPSFAPPNWLFAPVWITLFLLTGIALYLVWECGLDRKGVREALVAFGVQLGLNVLWTAVFFGLRSISGGLAVIWLLLFAIALTIILFRRVSRPAAWLLIPSLLWTAYATVLSAGYLALNSYRG